MVYNKNTFVNKGKEVAKAAMTMTAVGVGVAVGTQPENKNRGDIRGNFPHGDVYVLEYYHKLLADTADSKCGDVNMLLVGGLAIAAAAGTYNNFKHVIPELCKRTRNMIYKTGSTAQKRLAPRIAKELGFDNETQKDRNLLKNQRKDSHVSLEMN